MALKHAILASLLSSDASGYELSKVFDVAVSDFWQASRQQIYSELTKLEADGLVSGREVRQTGRPDKRVFKLTRAGKRELREFSRSESRAPVVRDDLMVKLHATDAGDVDALIEQLEARAVRSTEKAQMFERLLVAQRGEQSEDEFLAATDRVGPYLTCLRGLLFEQENAISSDWAAAFLRARRDGKKPPKVPDGLLPRE